MDSQQRATHYARQAPQRTMGFHNVHRTDTILFDRGVPSLFGVRHPGFVRGSSSGNPVSTSSATRREGIRFQTYMKETTTGDREWGGYQQCASRAAGASGWRDLEN